MKTLFGDMTPREKTIMWQTLGLSILGFLIGSGSVAWWLIQR
jgi:hypothetical protein